MGASQSPDTAAAGLYLKSANFDKNFHVNLFFKKMDSLDYPI